MQTIDTRYSDGTRATYTLAPGSTVALQLSAIKPARTKLARTEKRLFPAYVAGVDSTADYIRRYFQLNSQGITGKPCAYDRYEDHLTLYAPLPDTPAAVYAGTDTVETVEE